MSAERKFDVGDRVSIVSTGSYIPNETQGLLVGNTGTIRSVYDNCYGVETDNAEDSLSMDGGGWAFFECELEKVGEK